MAQDHIRNRTEGGGRNGLHELPIVRLLVDGHMEYWRYAGVHQLQPDGRSIGALGQVIYRENIVRRSRGQRAIHAGGGRDVHFAESKRWQGASGSGVLQPGTGAGNIDRARRTRTRRIKKSRETRHRHPHIHERHHWPTKACSRELAKVPSPGRLHAPMAWHEEKRQILHREPLSHSRLQTSTDQRSACPYTIPQPPLSPSTQPS